MEKRRNVLQLYFLLLGLGLGIINAILAKYIPLKSSRRFQRIINKKSWHYGLQWPHHNLAIVLFYRAEKGLKRRDSDKYEKIENLLSVLKVLDKRFDKSSNLLFIAVNLDLARNKELENLYNIKSVPKILLFKDGLPAQDKEGKVVSATGFIPVSELSLVIKKHFDPFIKDNIKRKAKINSLKSYYYDTRSPGFYYGYSYGWPYYGGYWGWPYRGYGWRGYYRGCW